MPRKPNMSTDIEKSGDWKPWIEKVHQIFDTEVMSVVFKRPKKYHKAAALALSVAKWHPSRLGFQGQSMCACCMYADAKCKDKGQVCDACPAFEVCGVKTGYEVTLWRKWSKAFTGEARTKCANRIYKTLYRLYREELKRIDYV